MIAVKHFLLYLPREPEGIGIAAQIRQNATALGYETSLSSYLFAYQPFRKVEVPGSFQELFIRITAGTEKNIGPKLSDLANADAAGKYAADTIRLYNLITAKSDTLEVVSDPLGVLPYYVARLGGSTVICSSLQHLFAVCPQVSREADEQAVFEFLGCGTPLGSRSLHKDVRLASAGQVVRWRRGDGIRIDRAGRVEIPAADAALASANAAEQIAGHVRNSLRVLPSNGVITLTGGYDSRLITCFALDEKLDVKFVTLGYERFEEIRAARAVARSVGHTTKVFTPPHPDVLDLVPVWLETLEGLADSHMLFMANLLSLPDPDGLPIYHGFIGDTMSGARLDAACNPTARTPQDIAKSISAYWFGGMTPNAGEQLGLAASPASVLQDIQDELVTDAAPHQSVTLWNLENIQRRLVGHQLLYLGRRFMPAPVFYYPPLMKVWLSVPRMALDNRALLLYLYQKMWPKLSTIPHADNSPVFIPRTRAAVRYVASWYLRRYGWHAARKMKINSDKFEARTTAWYLWHGTTPSQRVRELAALEETLDLLKARLGWKAPAPTDALFASCVSVPRKQLLMLRRLYLLAEYAKSIPKAAAVANVS